MVESKHVQFKHEIDHLVIRNQHCFMNCSTEAKKGTGNIVSQLCSKG